MYVMFHDYSLYIVMFFIAMISGAINVVSGGGGFLSISALLLLGLPPSNALATNKVQSFGSCVTSGLCFLRKGGIDLETGKFIFFSVFVGAAVGTVLIQFIDVGFLRKLIPIIMIAIAIYFILTPTVNNKNVNRRVSLCLFCFIISLVGFYDGFLGAGAGTFYTIAYISLWGVHIDKAQMNANFLNLSSNIASVLFFIFGGKIIWPLGIVMLIGQIFGGYFGAKLVITKGKKIIKPMIIFVSIIISLNLIYESCKG
ncbi:TSUP family transporter [Hafnia alvei]|uniref:Probable membrane transporter protein n=1 Tax=Hafnia alvei TaxID=569 RepID=A0A1C6Z6E9_HAFAL|nr:TSUP family transporter [Hafnia alvei]SCM54671.1 hypothetical protein BN1044_04181 [Hafnia alvei]